MKIKNQNFKIFVFCFIIVISILSWPCFISAQTSVHEPITSSVEKIPSGDSMKFVIFIKDKALDLWTFISQKTVDLLAYAAKSIEPIAPDIKEEFKKELTEMKEDLSGVGSFIWSKAKKWILPAASNIN